MPNNDLISREAILDRLYNSPGYKDSYAGLFAMQEIADAPAVDAEPVRRGWWRKSYLLNGKQDLWPPTYQCSECDRILFGGPETNYCPNCGAKMDKKE